MKSPEQSSAELVGLEKSLAESREALCQSEKALKRALTKKARWKEVTRKFHNNGNHNGHHKNGGALQGTINIDPENKPHGNQLDFSDDEVMIIHFHLYEGFPLDVISELKGLDLGYI